MMKLVIEDEEGRRRIVPLTSDEITIGRGAQGNTISLEERNVSRRHARFVQANGAVFIEDLGSANGTRVNGQRIEGRRRIREGDLIQIGDYDLALQGGEEQTEPPRSEAARPDPPPAGPAEAIESPREAPVAAAAPPTRPSRGAAGRALLVGAAVFLAATALGFLAGLAHRALERSPPDIVGAASPEANSRADPGR